MQRINFYLILAPQYLPFLTLGSTSGVKRTFFPSLVDSLSDAIYIPGGFKFGQNNHTRVYVSPSYNHMKYEG